MLPSGFYNQQQAAHMQKILHGERRVPHACIKNLLGGQGTLPCYPHPLRGGGPQGCPAHTALGGSLAACLARPSCVSQNPSVFSADLL